MCGVAKQHEYCMRKVEYPGSRFSHDVVAKCFRLDESISPFYPAFAPVREMTCMKRIAKEGERVIIAHYCTLCMRGTSLSAMRPSVKIWLDMQGLR